MVERVGDEYVIMNTSSAEVYTLNSTAAAVWDSLFDGRVASLECLVALGFSRPRAEEYYDSFVDRLVGAGIVTCPIS